VLFGAAKIRGFCEGKKSGFMKGLLRLRQQLTTDRSHAWEYLNGRSAFGLEWDAERPWLHSHAERGNDHLAGSDREMDTEGIHAVITAHKHIPTMHQRNGLDVFDNQNAHDPPQSVVASAG
jgi:hypothetical protein